MTRRHRPQPAARQLARRHRPPGCRCTATPPPAPPSSDADPRRPRLRPALHRPHGPRPTGRPSDGWHDARARGLRPARRWTRPRSFIHYGQAIFEGLKAYRHADGSLHTFRPEANAAALRAQRPPPGDGRAARRSCSCGRGRGPGARGRGLGARRPGEVAVPAAVHVRHRGRPRRAPGQRLPVPAHRLPGRRVLPARRASRSRCGCRRTTSARPRAARARPSARATTPPR